MGIKKTPRGLIGLGGRRFGKDKIRKEINEALDEMPDGFYYQYRLEVLTEEEYLRREGDKREKINP